MLQYRQTSTSEVPALFSRAAPQFAHVSVLCMPADTPASMCFGVDARALAKMFAVVFGFFSELTGRRPERSEVEVAVGGGGSEPLLEIRLELAEAAMELPVVLHRVLGKCVDHQALALLQPSAFIP